MRCAVAVLVVLVVHAGPALAGSSQLAAGPAVASPRQPELGGPMEPHIAEDVARVTDPEPVGKVYDAVVLRPLGFVQLVVGAIFLVPAWPVSLLFGEGDFVVEACVGAPAEQVFGRPLGQR